MLLSRFHIKDHHFPSARNYSSFLSNFTSHDQYNYVGLKINFHAMSMLKSRYKISD